MKTLQALMNLVTSAIGLVLMFQGLRAANHYHDYAHAAYLTSLACVLFLQLKVTSND